MGLLVREAQRRSSWREVAGTVQYSTAQYSTGQHSAALGGGSPEAQQLARRAGVQRNTAQMSSQYCASCSRETTPWPFPCLIPTLLSPFFRCSAARHRARATCTWQRAFLKLKNPGSLDPELHLDLIDQSDARRQPRIRDDGPGAARLLPTLEPPTGVPLPDRGQQSAEVSSEAKEVLATLQGPSCGAPAAHHEPQQHRSAPPPSPTPPWGSREMSSPRPHPPKTEICLPMTR